MDTSSTIQISDEIIVRKLTTEDWIDLIQQFGRKDTAARTLAVVARAAGLTIAEARALPRGTFNQIFHAMVKQGSFD